MLFFTFSFSCSSLSKARCDLIVFLDDVEHDAKELAREKGKGSDRGGWWW
jgi:hypothetical protein